MKGLLLNILAFFIFNDLIGQKPIENWKKFPIPLEEEIYKYNNSGITWFVSLNSKDEIVAENKIARFPTIDTLPSYPTSTLCQSQTTLVASESLKRLAMDI